MNCRATVSEGQRAVFAEDGQTKVAPTGTQSVADGPQPTHRIPAREGPGKVIKKKKINSIQLKTLKKFNFIRNYQ